MRVLSVVLLSAATLAFTAGCVTSTPQRRIDKNRGAYAGYPAEAQRMIREGRVEIGFTAEMAEMALGRPGRKFMRRDETSEDSEIWVYYRNQPRFSFGMAMGSGGYRGVGTGISMSTAPDPDQESLRLILRDGRVAAIERVTR